MSSPRLLDSDALPGRLALSLDEAAAALGVSPDLFDAYIRPKLRLVPVGRRRIVPVSELKRYLDESASRVLDDLQ